MEKQTTHTKKEAAVVDLSEERVNSCILGSLSYKASCHSDTAKILMLTMDNVYYLQWSVSMLPSATTSSSGISHNHRCSRRENIKLTKEERCARPSVGCGVKHPTIGSDPTLSSNSFGDISVDLSWWKGYRSISVNQQLSARSYQTISSQSAFKSLSKCFFMPVVIATTLLVF